MGLKDQATIEDRFKLVIGNLETTLLNWSTAVPGAKRVWLEVAKNDLEKLIKLAEWEESTADRFGKSRPMPGGE